MTAWSTPSEIEMAAQTLARGDLVAFPTETVYGLGANASDAQAVAKIFMAKGRPSNHPVIVHVAHAQAASDWVSHMPQQARSLMDAFWPGPLTLILPRASWVDSGVSGGQDSVGLRCPSHPVAQALLGAFGRLRGSQPCGIAAPSANRYGRVSPTTSRHVRHEFEDLIQAGMPVLEGGAAEYGIESTIVDLSRLTQGQPPALLRPGSVSVSDIESVMGMRLGGHDVTAPRVPGSVKAHYAPRTPLRLIEGHALLKAVTQWLSSHASTSPPVSKQLAVVAPQERCTALQRAIHGQEEASPSTETSWARVSFYPVPNHPVAYAQLLYAQLHAIDALGVDQLYWETVPQSRDWDGVRDRLQRAAAAFESHQ